SRRRHGGADRRRGRAYQAQHPLREPMNLIFNPAVAFMGRIRFSSKFALISLLFALPIAFLSWMLVSELNSTIAFAEKERTGVAYNRAVLAMLQHVQHHRGLAGGLLNGDK